jgi:predicted transcriptional regulator
MSHAIHLSDEAYQALEQLAREREQTPENVLEQLIESAQPSVRTAYETEDWFRHLGATEEQIRESARLAALAEDDQPTESRDANA